jgi:hypothetical protein
MTPVDEVIPGRSLPVTEFAKHQPQYRTLPGYRAHDSRGTVITRWKLTWRERFRIFVMGDLWLTMLTFNQKLMPVKLSVDPPDPDQCDGGEGMVVQ